MINLPILMKFHGPGARFAYYPPLSQWEGQSQANWQEAISKYYRSDKGIDLYIHIPYCKQLCTFCGCNIKITNKQEEEDHYIDHILREWNEKRKNLQIPKLATLTLAGGSVNFLSPKAISKLLKAIFSTSERLPGFRHTIEIDPRHFTKEWAQAIKEFPIHLFSMGVQDFNEAICSNVNRHQTNDHLSKAISLMRDLFPSAEISMDLIYGLPLQTQETMKKWESSLKEYAPDQISFYPLADVPWQRSAQQAFGHYVLPTIKEKYQLFLAAHNILEKMELFPLGLGHYARPSSVLSLAQNQSPPSIERRVMGFSPKLGSIMIGLGVSSINQAGPILWQNQRVLGKYLHQENPSKEERIHIQSHRQKKDQEGLREIICKKRLPIDFPEEEIEVLFQNNLLDKSRKNIGPLGVNLLKVICQKYINLKD